MAAGRRKKILARNPVSPLVVANTKNKKEENDHNDVSTSLLPLKWFSAIYFLLLALVTYGSLLNSVKGRTFMLTTEAYTRSSLIAVPLSKRGTFWKLKYKLLETMVHYPLMKIGYQNNNNHLYQRK